MSQENVEAARRVYPGPLDLVALLADRKPLRPRLSRSSTMTLRP
jgi:hypothetical protein